MWIICHLINTYNLYIGRVRRICVQKCHDYMIMITWKNIHVQYLSTKTNVFNWDGHFIKSSLHNGWLGCMNLFFSGITCKPCLFNIIPAPLFKLLWTMPANSEITHTYIVINLRHIAFCCNMINPHYTFQGNIFVRNLKHGDYSAFR